MRKVLFLAFILSSFQPYSQGLEYEINNDGVIIPSVYHTMKVVRFQKLKLEFISHHLKLKHMKDSSIKILLYIKK